MTTSRRTFMKNTAALSLAGFLPWQKDLFHLFNTTQSEMYLIRENVGVFKNRGGTIGWLFNEEGTVIVDSQFPESAEDLIGRMKEKADRPIDLLINTHHHGDHTGGNIAFKDIVGEVIAHKNSISNQKRVAKERAIEDKQLYPNSFFVKDWSTTIGGETISLHYFGEAHTNGDSVTHFENANVAHMGDLLFNRRFPYIDRNSGASIKNWIHVLDTIHDTFDKDTIFIFGHAGAGYDITGTRADLKAKRDYLEALLDFMGKAIKEGKTPETLTELKVIPGAEEWKGKGIERNIKAAYAELTEGKGE